MNFYLIKLIFFVLAIISFPTDAVDIGHSSDDHFKFAELDAKPLKINIKEQFSHKESNEEGKNIHSLALELIKEQYDTNSVMERTRTFERFVVSRSYSDAEVCHPDLHEQCLVNIKDGLLYQNGELLTTDGTIWALNPQGILSIYPRNKSYLLAGRPHANHSLFFQKNDIGLPIACAGHIEVREGKIKWLNNHSGHYMISTLQFILAIHYLYEKGIFADDLVIDFPFATQENSGLHTLLSIANMIELG
jgi:hypothetical protein